MDVEQTSTQIVVRTARYRLEFCRVGDRWRHVLFVGGELALESIESLPEERAPASPAFQDLLVERGAGDVCEIQLFGQCGKQVYSAAVRCEEAQGHFDVSVRDRNEAPVPARSSYALRFADGFAVSAELGVCTLSENACEIRADEDSVMTSPTGRTRRWAYRVEVTA